jgi:hypothetical protein
LEEGQNVKCRDVKKGFLLGEGQKIELSIDENDYHDLKVRILKREDICKWWRKPRRKPADNILLKPARGLNSP